MVSSRINTLSLLKKEETSKINLSTGQEILIHISSKSCPAHLWSLPSERVLGCKFSLAISHVVVYVSMLLSPFVPPSPLFSTCHCSQEIVMESVSFPGQLLPRSSDQPLWSRGLAGAAVAAASPLQVSTCQPFMGVLMLKLSYPRARICGAKMGCWVLCPRPEESSEWVSDSCSVTSDSLRPHGPWPDRPLCPWDSPGENTGVGGHFLLQAQKRTPEETSRPRGCTADQRLMPPGQETLLWPETRAQGSENLRQQHAWRVLFCAHPIQPPELFSSPSNHPNLSCPRPPRSLLRLLPYAPLSNSQTSYPATGHICTPCLCFFA